MKITHVSVERVKVPLANAYEIALGIHDSVELAYVTLKTSNGLLGYGAASPGEFVTGESMEKSLDALDAYRQILFGHSPVELLTLHRLMVEASPNTPAALAAVDMALYDLFSKSLNVPVVKLLGQMQESLPTSVTIGISSIDETLEKAEEWIGKGFKILKIKLGNEIDEDIERLIKLREKYSDIGIRVDPNQGYSCDELISFQDAVINLNLEFVEQPCKPSLDAILAENLKSDLKSRLPLAADESLVDASSAIEFIGTHDLYEIFNIKLMKCGGITSARKIISIAEAAKKTLMWGCNDESEVSIAAALNVALTSTATRYLDLDGHFDLTSDHFGGGVILKDGNLSLSGRVGLGVEKVVEKGY